MKLKMKAITKLTKPRNFATLTLGIYLLATKNTMSVSRKMPRRPELASLLLAPT